MKINVKSSIAMLFVIYAGKYAAVYFFGVDDLAVFLGIVIGVLSTIAYDIAKEI